VAIARALVNNPEIILADEPTGALDSKTSRQILDILKEISKEKLVIMVTHNGDLAEKYSTRLVRMLDGVITEDSDPYDSEKDVIHRNEVEQIRAAEQVQKENKKNKTFKKNKDKTAMSFFTALKLSFKNLLTKKTRTILTAIAGSIGIIGIALIMSVSNGMNIYIEKMQADSLSNYPITVGYTAIDTENLAKGYNRPTNSKDMFPDAKEIYSYVREINLLLLNKFDTKEYKNYLSDTSIIKPEWYNDIMFETGLNWNIYGKRVENPGVYEDLARRLSFNMLVKDAFLKTQYDILGEWEDASSVEPASRLTLFVDESNRLIMPQLQSLGLIAMDDPNTSHKIGFEGVLGREYKIFANDDLYSFNGTVFSKRTTDLDFSKAKTVTITAIARIKENTDMGSMGLGLGYSRELAQWLQEKNIDSEIVQWLNTEANKGKDPINLSTVSQLIGTTGTSQWDTLVRGYGGKDIPNDIRIYPVNFEAKELIKEKLNDYNVLHPDAKIYYNDMADLVSRMVQTLIDAITWVLVGITGLSLVVSSIMIAIITYVSVLERTKEIGVLRAIGARKRDITRVFIAEVFIIGLFAGVLGVGVAYLLTIPINLILGLPSITGISGLAKLAPLAALVLVGISAAITIVAGFLPSRMAAKKDPVIALRTE